MQTCLFDPTSPDWLMLESDPRAEVVKVGHGRTMWRVSLPWGTVFAKVVDVIRLAERWKHRLLGSAAKREWRAALEADARGVRVARCLALGVRNKPLLRTVLLSEGLPSAVGLAEVWERRVESLPQRKRRTAAQGLLDTVARLFAVAHERGLVHGDAHPGNILVTSTGASDADTEAVFVDMHSARVLRGPVSPRLAADSLAQIDRYFHRRATRTERLRCLHAYLSGRPSMTRYLYEGNARRRFHQLLERASAVHKARLARHWDRRVRRTRRHTGKYFATFDVGAGWRATAALTLERRHVFPEADVPDRKIDDWRAVLRRMIDGLPDSSSCGRTFDLEGFSVEVRSIDSLPGRLSAYFGRSAQFREFEHCHKLRHRDSAAELILAYAEHRSGGLVDMTMLLRPQVCV